jgi:EpsI family protein
MRARLLVLSACLLVGATLVARANDAEQVPLRAPLANMSRQIGLWAGRDEPQLTSDIVAVLGVDEYINRAYVDGAGQPSVPVWLYVGYYKSQREGDTIHSPLNCIPGSGWQPVRSARPQITVPGATSPITVNRLLIEKGIERQVVVYWYQAHGRVVASEYWSKLFMVYDAVRLNRSDAALVRVISPVLSSDSDSTAAENRVTKFVQQLFPQLNAHLPS